MYISVMSACDGQLQDSHSQVLFATLAVRYRFMQFHLDVGIKAEGDNECVCVGTSVGSPLSARLQYLFFLYLHFGIDVNAFVQLSLLLKRLDALVPLAAYFQQ